MNDLQKCLIFNFDCNKPVKTISNIDRIILLAKKECINNIINDNINIIYNTYSTKIEWLIRLALINKRYGDDFITYIQKHLPNNIVNIIQTIYQLEKTLLHINKTLCYNLQYDDYAFNSLLDDDHHDDFSFNDLINLENYINKTINT